MLESGSRLQVRQWQRVCTERIASSDRLDEFAETVHDEEPVPIIDVVIHLAVGGVLIDARKQGIGQVIIRNSAARRRWKKGLQILRNRRNWVGDVGDGARRRAGD